MLERAPGIFEVELHSNQKSIDEIKIFLIPGKDGERSLMVDAGFRSRTSWKRRWENWESPMTGWIYS